MDDDERIFEQWLLGFQNVKNVKTMNGSTTVDICGY